MERERHGQTDRQTDCGHAYATAHMWSQFSSPPWVPGLDADPQDCRARSISTCSAISLSRSTVTTKPLAEDVLNYWPRPSSPVEGKREKHRKWPSRGLSCQAFSWFLPLALTSLQVALPKWPTLFLLTIPAFSHQPNRCSFLPDKNFWVSSYHGKYNAY